MGHNVNDLRAEDDLKAQDYRFHLKEDSKIEFSLNVELVKYFESRISVLRSSLSNSRAFAIVFV